MCLGKTGMKSPQKYEIFFICREKMLAGQDGYQTKNIMFIKQGKTK